MSGQSAGSSPVLTDVSIQCITVVLFRGSLASSAVHGVCAGGSADWFSLAGPVGTACLHAYHPGFSQEQQQGCTLWTEP
jgi:hypothetical protein